MPTNSEQETQKSESPAGGQSSKLKNSLIAAACTVVAAAAALLAFLFAEPEVRNALRDRVVYWLKPQTSTEATAFAQAGDRHEVLASAAAVKVSVPSSNQSAVAILPSQRAPSEAGRNLPASIQDAEATRAAPVPAPETFLEPQTRTVSRQARRANSIATSDRVRFEGEGILSQARFTPNGREVGWAPEPNEVFEVIDRADLKRWWNRITPLASPWFKVQSLSDSRRTGWIYWNAGGSVYFTSEVQQRASS